MLYQGQPLTTPTAPGATGFAGFGEMLGIAPERIEQIENVIEQHYLRCNEGDEYDMGQFLTTCPVDAQTPAEAALVGMLMGRAYQHAEQNWGPDAVRPEPMYCLFSPDGEWQALSLAPDYAHCIAAIRLMHKAKMGRSFHELKLKGFKVLPVMVSIAVSGDENTAFTTTAA